MTGTEVSGGTLPAMRPMLLDDEDTWPRELVAILRGSLGALAAYEETRDAIDMAAEEDILLRVYRPPNEHEAVRQEILEACDRLTAGVDLVGWHCTRLTVDEATDIRLRGMRPLSAELASERLARAENDRLLPFSVLEALRERNLLNAPYRQDRIHLILSKALLRQAQSVYRLLAHWGGEALYGAHDRDDNGDIARALRTVGQPSLVQVALPGRKMGSYCSPGERAMRVFLGRRGINTGHEVSFAAVIRGARIPPERVIRVISREDADFEALTGCAGWRRECQV